MKVLITGASGPLGAALCAAFADRGAEVVATDLTGTDHDCDLRDQADLGRLIETVGKVDVVINNAKVDAWTHVMRLGMLATKAIVNVASIYGALGVDQRIYVGTEISPSPAWYAAEKGAMIALTRWQATVLAPVRANAVCPGGIERGHSEHFKAQYSARVPLKRMATIADVVQPVMFLAGEGAAYISGQVLMVDGGLSAW